MVHAFDRLASASTMPLALSVQMARSLVSMAAVPHRLAHASHRCHCTLVLAVHHSIWHRIQLLCARVPRIYALMVHAVPLDRYAQQCQLALLRRRSDAGMAHAFSASHNAPLNPLVLQVWFDASMAPAVQARPSAQSSPVAKISIALALHHHRCARSSLAHAHSISWRTCRLCTRRDSNLMHHMTLPCSKWLSRSMAKVHASRTVIVTRQFSLFVSLSLMQCMKPLSISPIALMVSADQSLHRLAP